MDKGKSLVLDSYTVQKRLSSTHYQLQGPLTPFDLRQATLFLSQKSLFFKCDKRQAMVKYAIVFNT